MSPHQVPFCGDVVARLATRQARFSLAIYLFVPNDVARCTARLLKSAVLVEGFSLASMWGARQSPSHSSRAETPLVGCEAKHAANQSKRTR
eukprot:1155048-Pelagomonas_calceolata.AAC.1